MTETQEILYRPISQEEALQIIIEMPLGKSPRVDGFTSKYYKTFQAEIAPWLVKTFNGLKDGLAFGEEALRAQIIVIPKNNKLCSSYRPISLINKDIKILAKILASRIAPHIPS